MTVSLGVLLSGSGTTLQNFLDRIEIGELDATVCCVIASRPGIAGIDKAERAGIPHHLVPRREHPDTPSFSAAVTAVLERYEPDLVLLAGFLSLWHIPPAFAGKVMNIHPALIPSFSGKGYYGMRVHRAAIDAGVKLSGVTVHFADNVYDHGPIILQRAVPVLEQDTPETLQARVFAEECEAYPEAVRLFLEGRLTIEGDRVRIS